MIALYKRHFLLKDLNPFAKNHRTSQFVIFTLSNILLITLFKTFWPIPNIMCILKTTNLENSLNFLLFSKKLEMACDMHKAIVWDSETVPTLVWGIFWVQTDLCLEVACQNLLNCFSFHFCLEYWAKCDKQKEVIKDGKGWGK